MEIDSLTLIWRGLVIGVGAGITNGPLFAAYNRWDKYKTKQKQVQFIHDCVVKNFIKIYNAEDLPPPAPSEQPVSKDIIRFALYGNFQTELQAAASYRTTALDYAQVSDLQQTIEKSNIFLNNLDIPNERLAPINLYRQLYSSFAALEWLRLPEDPPQ